MKTKNSYSLDQLLSPLGDCLLTEETACRIVKLKADAKLRKRVEYLGKQCNEGLLTPEEDAEYRSYVSFSTFMAILQSKARILLANTSVK
jgi:hypothetical protein